jgi:precorrin-6Y C5,15-methyltransferase (decarboxylating)
MEMVKTEKNRDFTILSCGIGKESIPANFAEIVDKADILLGGRRLLDLFPDFNGEKIIADKHIKETIAKLAENRDNIVILASGDALFHGIAKTVLNTISADRVRIVPNITAAQALCAKIALPWDNISFFSLHNRNSSEFNWHNAAASAPALIYGDHKCNAANIAENLILANPAIADSPAVIGADLGLEAEKVITASLRELSKIQCSALSILVLLEHTKNNPAERVKLGVPDCEYSHHNNMITHSEVRAVVLSKLQLRNGVLWDIGAGSGSVGIEAAGLQKNLKVFSIEKNEERIEDIKKNIKKFHTINVTPVSGDALNELKTLPDPDLVFIGGGGNDISELINTCFQRLKPGGTLVATAVLLETRAALAETLKKNCREVVSISVSRSKQLGKSRLMKSDNSIEIYVYKK